MAIDYAQLKHNINQQIKQLEEATIKIRALQAELDILTDSDEAGDLLYKVPRHINGKISDLREELKKVETGQLLAELRESNKIYDSIGE